MPVFIERSRFGKTFYATSGNQLKVSGQRGGVKFEQNVDFNDISPDVRRGIRRFYGPTLRIFGLGVALVIITVALLRQKVVPVAAVGMIAELTGIISVGIFVLAYRWSSPIEVVRFKNTLGAPLFDMIKEKSYGDEFEGFVQQLREGVRRSKNLNQEPALTPPLEPLAARGAQENWWKVSLAFGLLAVGLPQFKEFTNVAAAGDFIVVFACSIGGALLSAYSFLKKERFRYASLIGAVLSLAPPFFYK